MVCDVSSMVMVNMLHKWWNRQHATQSWLMVHVMLTSTGLWQEIYAAKDIYSPVWLNWDEVQAQWWKLSAIYPGGCTSWNLMEKCGTQGNDMTKCTFRHWQIMPIIRISWMISNNLIITMEELPAGIVTNHIGIQKVRQHGTVHMQTNAHGTCVTNWLLMMVSD